MRLVVIGGRGQAGTEFCRFANDAGLELVTPSRREIDVRDASSVNELVAASRPSWVVNFAAFHDLEACETDFSTAMAVNCVAVRALALEASRAGARFLTVSTDYVFDGGSGIPYSEDDRALPLQAYGTSKRAGELAALAAAPESTFVVRTCGLYGYTGSRERLGNFVEKRIVEGGARNHIVVGSDLTCTPTSASAFANAVFRLIEHREAEPGVYHMTAEGACSWAEFTAEIFRLAGVECRVEPVDRRGDYGRVRRPSYSVLRNRRGAALGIRLPDWTDDLARYVAGR